MTKEIQTKANERVILTADPKQMLGKYIRKDVLKSWTEDFMDEGTGEVISVTRSDKLFERGTYINQDVLAEIRFYIQDRSITEIEVTSQERRGYFVESNGVRPWMVTLKVADKNKKLLLMAESIGHALVVAKDFAELNYSGTILFNAAKKFDDCEMLSQNVEPIDKHIEFLKGNVASDELLADEINEQKSQSLSFYQIELFINFADGALIPATFVVQASSIDSALNVIRLHVAKRQEDEELAFTLELTRAVPLSLAAFVPIEFTNAHLINKTE